MKKELYTQGNTWQLYIKASIARLMGITPQEYTVNLDVKEKILYVKKVTPAEAELYKDLLCKKLIKRSSGYGLNMTIAILEMLDINPETDMVDVDINGQVLIIKKA